MTGAHVELLIAVAPFVVLLLVCLHMASRVSWREHLERRANSVDAVRDEDGVACCPHCVAPDARRNVEDLVRLALKGSWAPVRLWGVRRMGPPWWRRTVGTCPDCGRAFEVHP